MRFWIAVALLSVSWLLGVDFYAPARIGAWIAAVAAATGLLAGVPLRLPGKAECLLAAALLAPAIWLLPWPCRAAPLVLGVGLPLQCLPIPQRWPKPVGRGAVAAGMMLLVQFPALQAYIYVTARSHDFPSPLGFLVAAMARLSGVHVALDRSTLVIPALRGPLRLGLTWDLLVDPATLLFLVGGLVLLGLAAWRRPEGGRRAAWGRASGIFAAAVLAWLPIRAAVLVTLLLHRAVGWDPAQRFNPMDQFLSPWVHLVLLAAPLLLGWLLGRWLAQEPAPAQRAEEPIEDLPDRTRRYAAALGLVAAALATMAWVLLWEPVGRRLEGRVMVVERHSTWEPTTRPYGTIEFGEDSSYTYAVIYDYLSRYYQMSRLLESDPISQAKLDTCDVLVIKTPTARYARDEVAAIRDYVRRGGGLLLIGEHTDVFKSSTFLNDVAREFGFKFRHDLLFRIGDPYVQWYEPPRAPHPIVQHVPRMSFAVSCSIDPGNSLGRGAVRNTGLWNLPPDYHTENYFPEAEYRPEMRCGAFIQLWATRSGAGRVAAWTDSTIFSNFSVFEPGKTELMLGMLEWLNRRSALDRAGLRILVSSLLFLAAVAGLLGGLHLAKTSRTPWLLCVAAGAFGAAAGSIAVAAVHRAAMPMPEPVRPMVRVVIDRTVSEVPLARGGFTREDGLGYGLLEQWIPRLGYFTARRSGPAAFEGDVLVVICPQKSASAEFQKGLVEYVAAGGKLLVIDSPDVSGSTANSLLWPFAMSVDHSASREGKLGLAGAWPGIAVAAVCEVTGGQPFMWVEGMPVAARASYGAGRVMAVGFGSLMNDDGLGGHWMADAEPRMLLRSDLLFSLVQALVEDRPVAAPPPRVSSEKQAGAKPESAGR